jgi:phenylacetate-CoA ligase
VPIDRHDLTREVQFCQRVPGEVELLVVTEGGQQPDFSDYLFRMAERSAGDLTIHLKVVDKLRMTGRGKRKFIDQQLTIPKV